MSFFGLSVIGSALDAFQEATNTTSNNIANVNTTGASRQVANLGQAAPVVGSIGYGAWTSGTQGSGVVVQSITRIHQDSYDGLFRGATSAQSYFDVEQQQLSSVQSAFGEPSNGVNSAFTSLQTAVSQLSSDPTDQSTRLSVMSAAQAFTGTLNRVGTAIQSAQSTVIQQASTTVDQANTLIDQIATLNGQIRASTAVGDNPNTYEDQRDAAIDTLSTLVQTQTSIQSNGSALVTVGGRALVNDTTAYHLADPVVGTDASGNPSLVIGMQGDSDPANPTPVPLGSGQLGGYVDVYNSKLTGYASSLDAFASAAANEIDRVTTASVDQNGAAGIPLLQAAVPSQPVTAANITVGVTDPSQITAGLISTAAGSLTTGVNAANDSVDTASALQGNTTLAHPAATTGPTTGTLTVTVDGVSTAYAYDFGATGNASTIDSFVANFNAANLGVTASFDSTSQKIVFARDPNNSSDAHRAAQGANATTPDFTITDSNAAAGGSQGTPSGSLLEVLGASAISGVQQNAANAYGTGDNGGANALLKVFSNNAGIPGLQTTANTTAATAPGTVTVGGATAAALGQVNVGQVLSIDANTANAEQVVVSAVDRSTGTVSFTAAKAHAAGFSIASAATTTLGAYYGGLVSQLGLDVQTATTGNTAQTSLASNIDTARQSVDGINIDEETQNLIKYQNSYQAAARTMNVLDTLLQTAIGLIT